MKIKERILSSLCAISMCFGLNMGSSALNWKKVYGVCVETIFCSYSLVKILQVKGNSSYVAGLIAVGLFGPDLFLRGKETYGEYKLEQKKNEKNKAEDFVGPENEKKSELEN